MGVIPWSPLAGGWLTGRYRKGDGRCRRARASDAHPGALRPVDAREPAQARRRRRARAARRRGRASRSIHMALAFVLQPPGGHVGDHRAADDGAAREPARRAPTSTLDDELLDRIDEIVPPGTNFNPADAGYTPPSSSTSLCAGGDVHCRGSAVQDVDEKRHLGLDSCAMSWLRLGIGALLLVLSLAGCGGGAGGKTSAVKLVTESADRTVVVRPSTSRSTSRTCPAAPAVFS